MVGVSKYSVRGVDWLKYANLDALAFAGWAKQQGCQNAAIQDGDAKVASVRQMVKGALQTAGPLDDVYLFFSGRGIGTPDAHAGFIILWDSKESEPASTAFSTDELNLYIRQSRARRIFLFADLRASDRLQPGNLIQFKLKDLVPDRKGAPPGNFSEILGSQPGQFSAELPDPKNPKSGSGAFSLVLLKGLQSHANTIQDLFDEIKKQLPAASPTHQSPWQFGPTIAPLRAITRLRLRPRNPFGAVLIRAFFTPGPQQTAADPASENDAVASENEGQQVLVEYGEGDQFPDEPGRPQQKDFERAAGAFQKALEIRRQLPPDRQDAALLSSLEARKLFCQGRAALLDPNQDYRDALKVLASSTEKRNDYPEAWNAMGVAYLEHAGYGDAQASFTRAIKLAPDWAYPRHNLALSYVERGDYATAEKEYREAIRRTPYQPYLYYNLGVLLQRINRKSDARTEYGLAIRTFEDQARIAMEHATRFSEDGDVAGAQTSEQRRATLLKNEAEAYNALGVLEQAEGRAKKARAAYEAAVKHNPDLLLPTYNLGILDAKKSPDTAIGLWQKVLAKDRDYLPAHQRLAETMQRLGKFQESADEYREVLRLQPDNSDARWRLPEVLGDLNASGGNKPEACKQYGLAEKASPENRREIVKKKKPVC